MGDVAYLYEGGLALVPAASPQRERCLHCCRGVPHLVGDCCDGCQERGHGGHWQTCGECRRETLLMGVEFNGP